MEEARGLKALNIWCKKVTKGYKGVNVKDMSSSWRDGLAFCAIIHHYRPDLIDFDSLSKENILYNNSMAFSIAEKQLGVPALLDAEDMEKFEQMDKLSIITYLSQLYNCFENQNKLNKVQPAIKRLLTEGESGPPAKVFSIEQKVPGGRKHDICLACKHRVYILERLIVGGKLYHRTCFKCSKCDALLKPGAYVEGENPGIYECAICPHDELNDLSAESISHKEGSQDKINQNFKLPHRSYDFFPGNDSPVEAPKLSLLSSSVNNARKSLMQRSFSSNSGNQESKANESIPVATESDEPNELSTPLTDYLPSDIQKVTTISDMDKNATGIEIESAKSQEVTAREGVITKEFPHTHSPQHSFASSLSSGHKESFPSSQRYKSVFLHDKIKTLKPLKVDFETNAASKMAKEIPSVSVSFSPGPHSADSIKAMNFNLPTIKSATYFSPIKASKSLPRPSSIANFHSPKEITPYTLSPVGRKGSSDGSLNELFHDKWSKIHRKGSLDSKKGTISLSRTAVDINKEMFHTEEKLDKIINLKDTETTQVTHERRKAEEQNENSSCLKKTTKGDICTEKNEDLAPKGIVKQLIQQKELSLAVSKAPMISKLKFIDSSQKMTYIPVNKKSDISEIETEKIGRKLQKQELPIPDFKQQEIIIKQQNETAKNDFIEEKYSSSCVPTKLQDKIPNIAETEITVVNKIEDTKERITSSGTEDEADGYPDDLNPFDDDNFNESGASGEFYPEVLNPFGDSDEENDLKIQTEDKHSDIYDESMNPFASDDEDQVLTAIIRNTAESQGLMVSESVSKNRVVPVPTVRTSIIAKNTEQYFQQLQHASSQQSIDFSESPTGTLRGTQKKRKAPAPPLLKDIFGQNESDTNKDSPYTFRTSPSSARLSKTPSPKPHKSKPAPPPPALFSTVQANTKDESSTSSTGDCVASGKQTKDMDNMKLKSFNRSLPTTNTNEKTTKNDPLTNNLWKKKKRPAPPVPIPPRREIKKIPLKEIQSEMTEIEEKQEELEMHGRELEVMIRDRDKDEEPTIEEEELIMQLFELVNQKNALFRRQAELMYIKRSQRLEEEQVELEYQIRCLMLKPVSQKTEEDIHCEEELVQRLLDVVDQRNEIVDSIEMDRRREAEEDISVQEQMDIKNSDLPITAEIKEKSVHKEKKSKHKHKEKGKDKKKHQEDSKNGTEEMAKRNTIHKIKKWF